MRDGTRDAPPRLQRRSRRFAMRLRGLSILAAIIALAACVQGANAGAIRFAAKKLHKGSITAVHKTSEAKATAVGNVGDAARTARAAVRNETGVVRTNVVSAPGTALRETKTAVGMVWKAVW